MTNRILRAACNEVCPVLAECRAHEGDWGEAGTQLIYSGVYSADTLPYVGDVAAKLDARPSRPRVRQGN